MPTFKNVGNHLLRCFIWVCMCPCILFERVCISLYRFAYNVGMAICIITKVIAFVPDVILHVVVLLGGCHRIVAVLTYIMDLKDFFFSLIMITEWVTTTKKIQFVVCLMVLSNQ